MGVEESKTKVDKTAEKVLKGGWVTGAVLPDYYHAHVIVYYQEWKGISLGPVTRKLAHD